MESPKPCSCASPPQFWHTAYLRGTIKSCFEDLQGTSDICGNTPDLFWGPWDVNFSWRKFGIKKRKRCLVRSYHSVGTESKNFVRALGFFKFLKYMVWPISATFSFISFISEFSKAAYCWSDVLTFFKIIAISCKSMLMALLKNSLKKTHF